jgi:hypothetical protein
MGGVGDFLFGSKPKAEKSESGNKAYDLIRSTYGPAMGYTTMGGNAAASLLGLGGVGGGGSSGGGGGKAGLGSSLGGSGVGATGSGTTSQTNALDNWANSGGMQFLREQGNKQITSNKAASGLLGSGSFGTALMKYGQGLGSTYLNQYMDNLFKLSNLGIQSGGLVTSAGQYSKGTGGTPGKGGAAPMILQAAAMAGMSDRRLKTNVRLLYTRNDGLNVYEYTLFGKRSKGVMADEVKNIIPEAYLPNFSGPFDGVDYGKIGKI